MVSSDSSMDFSDLSVMMKKLKKRKKTKNQSVNQALAKLIQSAKAKKPKAKKKKILKIRQSSSEGTSSSSEDSDSSNGEREEHRKTPNMKIKSDKDGKEVRKNKNSKKSDSETEPKPADNLVKKRKGQVKTENKAESQTENEAAKLKKIADQKNKKGNAAKPLEVENKDELGVKPEIEKKFGCSECPKEYDSLASLNRHLRVHKEYTFFCFKCRRAFARDDHRKKHEDVCKYKESPPVTQKELTEALKSSLKEIENMITNQFKRKQLNEDIEIPPKRSCEPFSPKNEMLSASENPPGG